MPLSNANYAAPLHLYFSQFPEMDPVRFSLLDVGASGGIDPFFRQLSPRLDAVGFDPLVSEVDRLNAEETDPGVRYEACWITQGQHSPLPDGFGEDTADGGAVQNYFALSSAVAAHANQNYDYIKEVFNSGDEVALSDVYQSVDEWSEGADFPVLDMLKVDVDGFDFQALNGAHALLKRDVPLMIITEAQVQETTQHVKATFGDIDVYMRSLGYRMLDVDMHRYSRSALPKPFKHDIFAQTTQGGMGACDALYMPDPVLDADMFDRIMAQRGPMGFVKLLIFYDMVGLEDFAAALVLHLQERGIALPCGDETEILDCLVPENVYGEDTYAGYVAAFKKNPKGLFPQAVAAQDHAADPEDAPQAALVPEAVLTGDWTQDLVAGPGTEDLGGAYINRPGAEGHIVFGPYITLPEGSYEARILYEILARGQGDAEGYGSVEIVLDETVVQTQEMTSDVQDLVVPFTVSSTPSQVQIRIGAAGGLRVLIKSVIVT